MELGESQLLLMKMIVGHGIDIEELASIQNAVEKREGFAQRVLTDKELKRMGTGIGKLGFQDLEVLNDEKGAPYFSKSPFSGNVWLSISHTEQFVTASVILEENHEN